MQACSSLQFGAQWHPRPSCPPHLPSDAASTSSRCQQPAAHRRVRASAGGKSSGGGPEDNKNARKADFSAYWSMKVRKWFSDRRGYLDAADATAEEEKKSAVDLWLDRKISEADEELQKRTVEYRKSKEAALAQAVLDYEEKLQKGGAQGETNPLELPTEQVLAARQHLQSFQVKGVAIGLQRADRLLRTALILPVLLLANAYKAWRANFTTQRYEMFLMAEGERIWYWRNRTENERWFWEVFAWDRVIFPVMVTIAYMYIVPNNFLWAVVIPCVFILWQTGQLPGPNSPDFWLIAYFGLWKKCGADVLRLLTLLTSWGG